MRCGSPLFVPSRLSNRDIPSYQSSRHSYRFPAPSYRIALFDSPCRSPIRFGGTRRPRLSPRVPFTIGGENLSPAWLSFDSRSALAMLPASLFVQSASHSPPRFAFRRAARCLPYYPLPYTTGGEDAYFSHTYSFSSSISTRHVIHFSIYMRAWWNGRHARFRFWWRNPCGFESHRPHHGNAQPAFVARSGSRGAGFFHAAETKIQSILPRHGRNGRAVSCT